MGLHDSRSDFHCSNGSLLFLGEGTDYMFLAVCLVIGNIGFAGGNVIYYAFMPYLARKEDTDHVSSWGYAYGFMGGSTILIVHLGLGLSFGFTPSVLAFIRHECHVVAGLGLSVVFEDPRA